MTEREARRRKRQAERDRQRDRLLRERRLAYTVRETSVLLGIGINQTYEAIKEKQIPSIKINEKRIIVPHVGIEKLLASAGSE